MRTMPLIVLVLVACTISAARTRHSSTPNNVKGSGCVEKAVENSCRVVIDSQTGELYNLVFPAKVPSSGTAIKFSGTKHKGATACTLGKPVKVSQWKKEAGIKCPPPAVIAEAGR